ncbi:stAR-related lipid transfer protein 9-like [Seriola dumerili]|uniref:stAR-related lipid transfer protein 9-like n=1 Tax=Seriola dumerili TaxID=41447 RepID=UPI000BBEF6EF|nr:stAR-related lipid transfer protein 9-like [Seriola dumerili]
MANVKVAIRVRPPNAREGADGGRLAVQVEDKFVRIQNVKLDGRADGAVDSREKLLEFCFDYCYWSVDPADPHYASQEEVFQDLGVLVLSGASEGYNVCLFAYGQTGSGKTYTMMGTPDSFGLTPRICQGLFRSEDTFPDGQNSSRVEISFLEIYNERVRDLLRGGEQKKRASLRVREHPEKGPYVQDLSQHVVTDYKQAMDLLEEGIANRITAATHNHDASSRSHAIFTIQYTQAILENNLPSETVSKINLVDLAGSERADPHYCRDRLTEGSNINKSLVTLGIVISALAQNSQMSSSCQSINSMASEGDGSTVGSHSSSLSGGGRRHCFIPYRDSVLTWLLKDSLGGNSKTIMIATVSPSANSYNETLSTLRYAAHARNIVNKPRVNEDANVRLIRELREEIDRLKSMLLSFEMRRNPSPSLSDERDGNLSDIVLQNELKVEQLTKDWSESWRDKKELLEQYSVDINRDQAGFLINSLQPHLVTLDRDVLSTGVVFYHLREGVTHIGPQDQFEEPQIVLQGSSSCEIENCGGVVTLRPLPGYSCLLNDREVTEPCRLAQGMVITLGEVHKFRFNHPAEAAVLRERRRASEGGMTCTYIDLCPLTPDHSVEEAKLQGQPGACISPSEESTARQRLEEQQHYVESLRQEIQAAQRRAERELEREQAHLRQQHIEIQQWITQEKQRLTTVEQRVTQESGVQTDVIPASLLERLASQASEEQEDLTVDRPCLVVRARKKAVEEELLKHHALCRTESRIRRKRLHYQLERIARKRHLLEAKRQLQQLEKALPPGLDSPESPELGSSSKPRGRPFASPLAEQLRHEEAAQSETESEDSQMSKDSLAVGSNGKYSRLNRTVVPNYSLVTDSSHLSMGHNRTVQSSLDWGSSQKPQVIPAEAYWSQQGSPKSRKKMEIGATRNPLSQSPLVADSRGKDTVQELTEDFGNMQTALTSSPRSLSSCSVREPENLLALTDAWSSTDAADSPRIHRDSLPFQRKMMFRQVESSSSSSSPTSMNLSDSQSGYRSYSSTSTSTEGVNVTVQEHRLVVSGEALTTPEDALVSWDQEGVEQPGRQSENVENTIIDSPDYSNNASPASLPTSDQATSVSHTGIPDTAQATSNLLQVFPDAPDVVVRDVSLSSDIEMCTSGCQSVMHFSTNPTNQGQALNKMSEAMSAFKPSIEDELQCNVDGAEKLKDVQQYEFENTKDVSLARDKTKDTELYIALQQELVKSPGKNSRKRNKGQQDAFMGSLKIPKRSDSRELVTFCSIAVGSQDHIWPDDNNNTSDSKAEESAVETCSHGFDSACAGGSVREDKAASVASPVSDPMIRKLGQVFEDSNCELQNDDKSSQSGSSVGDRKMVEKENVTIEEVDVETKAGEFHINNPRKHQENRNHIRKSDAICSAIDLRISEMVKEHITHSFSKYTMNHLLQLVIQRLTVDVAM